jgi:murein DD-endopeptidase MepM/ murein hydrolase activator NlpD
LTLALASIPASAATPASPAPRYSPGYDEQKLQAQADLARNQAQLVSLQQQEADLDHEAGQTEEQIRVARARAAALARILYVQPSSLLLVMARETNPVASLQDAIDLQYVAAHARNETVHIDQLQRHLKDVQTQRQQAAEQEALIRASLQFSLIKNAGIDVWGRARAWELTNPDWKIFPPNLNHSKSPLAAPVGSYSITQTYGPTTFYLEPSFNGFAHFHTGLDMSAPYGTAVQAADDGVVITTGFDPYGYGNYVVLGHPSARATLYGHLTKATVRSGDKITQGQQIGLVGSTGNSTGPHLHFEVLLDGLPVDPAPLITTPPGG